MMIHSSVGTNSEKVSLMAGQIQPTSSKLLEIQVADNELFVNTTIGFLSVLRLQLGCGHSESVSNDRND